jgi:hypothetical protein
MIAYIDLSMFLLGAAAGIAVIVTYLKIRERTDKRKGG